MRYRELPEDYALILQRINDDGGDDLDDLLDSVHVDRSRLTQYV